MTDEKPYSNRFSQEDTPASVVHPPSQAPLEQVLPLEEDIGGEPDHFIGERLGNYRLLRPLGQGGFADVYLGEHVFLKTHAAIKVLHREVRGRDLKTFLQEAQLIATLNHPHIVRVLEFGIKGLPIPEMELDLIQSLLVLRGQIPYLVMEYARGGTLRERYPKGTGVPLQQVILWLEALAQALDYAHEQKVIHRDIKPENILMTSPHHVVLSDFGIATLAHSEHSIKTLEMAGTVPYMAPEQIRGRPCPASDQYALAIVVYEWLAGERPFKGNVWEILEHHRSTPPPPLLTKMPSLPHAVDEVVMKALAKEPQRRFENVTAFASALSDASR